MGNSDKEKKTEEIKMNYVPVKPVDPNEYSVQQYLYDTNTLLTQIDNGIRMLIQIMANKEQEEKPRPRTIGIRHD